MAIVTTPRPNIDSSGLIEIIDGIEFEGFGSGGFDDNDLLIIGDDLDNIIEGGIGHDEIEGEDGDDTITGGDGNDTLEGDSGNDILDGQGGTDKLFGEDGDDILLAGSGFDRMSGGDGNDTFGFYGAGHFEISDFNVADDRLFFDSSKLGVDSLEQLVSSITNVEQDDNGVRVEFVDDAASITLVGVNLDDITPDMVIFNL